LIEIDEIVYGALDDKSQLHSTIQEIRNYIRNLLRQPRFARSFERAPNPTVTYIRHQQQFPHIEYEDAAGPSQPAPTRHTRRQNDDDAGPFQQQTQLDAQTLPPPDRERKRGGGRGRRELLCLL